MMAEMPMKVRAKPSISQYTVTKKEEITLRSDPELTTIFVG
jgi:hypothetical protein